MDVEFAHDYSRTGQGLHRFTDPEDGRVYLHTHFEPYDANRLFPAFDQPDLKARFTLTVSAPAGWTIVSTSRESSIEKAGDRRVWHFPETRPISTYIFPLHAGEYRVWKSVAGEIPLRLFARESLSRYVRPDDWFDLTRRGFAFFEEYFDLPYPYGKYDQLIVPEFNIGGMENVAAVTYTESYVRRGRYTRQDMERLTNTLLHEMSHMWFGDLVTPAWWDGLWLKEAFATYMGYLSQAEATPYTDAWHMFYAVGKQQAYAADQRVTTHPIEVPVGDTRYAFANFDDITYRKGSSVLTQLSYFVGQEAFRDGVRQYLKEHSDGVTELADFIRALERASGLSLDEWVGEWLMTAGVNTLEASCVCEDGKVTALSIEQSAPADYPQLREHRLQIGLYRWEGESFETDVLPVTVEGRITDVPTAVGLPCPELIYPNHGDWGFAKITLDAGTRNGLGARLPTIDDPLLRSMFWASLWDMVRDAELPLDEYLENVLAVLPGETNQKVLLQVTGNLYSAIDYLWLLPASRSGLRNDLGPRIEAVAWDAALAAEAGSEVQTIWADAFRRVARSPTAISRLAALLTGEETLSGYDVDQDRRWALLYWLNSVDWPAAGDLTHAEIERDPSDGGQASAIHVAAARPDPDTKRLWLDRVRDPDSGLTLARRRIVMSALFPTHQPQLRGGVRRRRARGPAGTRPHPPGPLSQVLRTAVSAELRTRRGCRLRRAHRERRRPASAAARGARGGATGNSALRRNGGAARAGEPAMTFIGRATGAMVLLALACTSGARGEPAGAYLGHLTWPEAERRIADSPIVIVPFGAGAKEHGPHLPMNADQVVMEHLLDAAVESRPVIVAPPVLHGWFPAFRDFPGTEIADPDVFADYVDAVARSLIARGAHRIVFLNTGIFKATGLPLSIVARDIRTDLGVPTLVVSWDDLETREAAALAEQTRGGHADEIETSINLCLQPERVHMDRAVTDYGEPPDKDYGGYRPGLFSRDPDDPRHSETGIFGDPDAGHGGKRMPNTGTHDE